MIPRQPTLHGPTVTLRPIEGNDLDALRPLVSRGCVACHPRVDMPRR